MDKQHLKFLILIGLRIGVSIIILSFLFKILHVDYSFELLCIGCAVTFSLYLVRTILKTDKTFSDWVKLLFVFSVCLRYAISFGHLPFPEVLKYGLAIIQFAGLAYLYFSDNLPKLVSRTSHSLLNILYGLGIFFIIVGALFKIMHWPGAPISLTIGVLMMIIWLITEPILVRKNPLLADTDSNGEILLDDFIEPLNKHLPVPKTNSASLLHLLALGLAAVGLIFKFLNWPGAGILIIIGLLTGLIFVFRRK